MLFLKCKHSFRPPKLTNKGAFNAKSHFYIYVTRSSFTSAKMHYLNGFLYSCCASYQNCVWLIRKFCYLVQSCAIHCCPILCILPILCCLSSLNLVLTSLHFLIRLTLHVLLFYDQLKLMSTVLLYGIRFTLSTACGVIADSCRWQ